MGSPRIVFMLITFFVKNDWAVTDLSVSEANSLLERHEQQLPSSKLHFRVSLDPSENKKKRQHNSQHRGHKVECREYAFQEICCKKSSCYLTFLHDVVQNTFM